MPSRDWTSEPYARVFASLATDHPEVWTEDTLLAWYVRLLLPADRAWPVALPWPRRIPDEVVARLVDLGALDAVREDHYRIHGMDRLMAAMDRRHRAGGVARGRGQRDARGRLTAGNAAGQMNGNEAPDAGRGPLVETLVEPEHAWALVESPKTAPETLAEPLDTKSPATRRNDNETMEEPLQAPPSSDVSYEVESGGPWTETEPEGPGGPSTVAEYRRAAESHGPDDAPCDEPDLHRLHHRWYAGVGWRCLLCESSDTRSFTERMEEARGRANF